MPAPKKKVPAKKKTTASKAPPKKRAAAKKPAIVKKKQTRVKPKDGYARSHVELGTMLQRSASAVSRYALHPDAPPKTEWGYHLEDWQSHIQRMEEGNGEFNRLRQDKVAIENWRTEQQGHLYRIKREIQEGKLATLEEVIAVVCQQMLPGMQTVFQRLPLELADTTFGLPREEIVPIVETKVREAFMELSRGNWAQKKTFWQKVYAELYAHLQNSTSGGGQKPISET